MAPVLPCMVAFCGGIGIAFATAILPRPIVAIAQHDVAPKRCLLYVVLVEVCRLQSAFDKGVAQCQSCAPPQLLGVMPV